MIWLTQHLTTTQEQEHSYTHNKQPSCRIQCLFLKTIRQGGIIKEKERNSMYIIELFQPDFTYRSSMQIENIDLEIDYLDIVKNKIKIPIIQAQIGDYIRISTSDIEIDGIVTSTKEDKNTITISYKSFFDIFDIDILVDVTQLTTVTMETFIANLITANYISNADTLQNIFGLSVSVLSGTSGTSLTLDSKIVNFYKDIIQSAFLQYNIVVSFAISTKLKQITCTVSKNIAAVKTIESDLPNIIKKQIDFGVTRESYNKLIVVNEANISEKLTYYLHPNNTIDTTNSNRILPIVFQTVFVTVAGGETFAQASYKKAVSILKQTEYNNLIELTMANGDTLINPLSLGIGQRVSVMTGTEQHQSILTGIRIGKTTTLIFGAIRKELTKKIKWGL